MKDGDWGTPTEEYYTVQNSFNQTFVTTVRETGRKNANHISFSGIQYEYDHAVNFATVPKDIVKKKD